MGETVQVDEKGRVVLPKKVREVARIGVNTKLVAKASGIGVVELSDPRVFVVRARDIGAKKLTGWKEENHEATSYLVKSVKTKNEAR
jgi:bifunctional DNA-binding transcriptional regulator/antitoxin component of YhaV-PrlF toxin-antitoxin module